MTTFGERQLLKQGWTKGHGLGLNQDGIHKPITVTIKNDNNGVND